MPDRQDDLSPASDLAPFADALKRLAPQPAHLSRDALLFEAGKAAGAPRVPAWVWPTAAGFFGCTTLVLAAFLAAPGEATFPAGPPIAQVLPARPPAPDARGMIDDVSPIAPPAPAAKPKKARPDDDSSDQTRMLQVKRDVLRWGVDMLPEPKPAASGPSPDVVARQVNHWLSLPPGTLTVHSTSPSKKKPADDDEDDK
ncbi:MAG TPA: hypothetical protein VKE40_19475 [Gemmataceae bacterium]|nr:hypothetical protein [Gemmataceae bacterium]